MKILIIEDNEDHFELINDALEKIEDTTIFSLLVNTIAEGESQLLTNKFDICLCDLRLPDSTIKQTIEWLSLGDFSTPIIILTSINSLPIAKNLLNQGIQDYIPKNEITPQLLYRTCKYAIERFKHQQVIENHNKDMQAFCSSLSHDFNGHISRIMGISKLIQADFKQKTTLTVEEETWFDYLNTSTTEIHQLVKDLQQYLSLNYVDKTFQLVDLNEVINKVSNSLEASVEKSFTVNIDNTLPTISVNSALIHLLFYNLLSNSIKFNENKPIITLSSNENEHSYCISVQDNGIGFDKDKAKEMFKPFKRLANKEKYSGSGLGLSIIKRVLEIHNAHIDIQSNIGMGSIFVISFKKIIHTF